MDPVSAFALAGTVAQFIDFGGKILSTSCQLYRSKSGTLTADEELSLVTKDLEDIISKLQHDQTLGENIGKLCDDARDLATQLKNRLEKCKVGGRFRGWSSVQAAIQREWTQGDQQSMRNRLALLRTALETRVLVSMRSVSIPLVLVLSTALTTYRENIENISVKQSARFDRLDEQTQLIISALYDQPTSDEKSDLLDQVRALTQLVSRLEAQNITEHRVTRAAFISGLRYIEYQEDFEKWRAKQDGPRPEPPDKETYINAAIGILNVSDEEERELRSDVNDGILNSLKFSDMTERYDKVAEAFENTYEWIFHDSTSEQLPWSSFVEWLTSSSGLYWITGKAGSGKSTLMRYIYDHARTQQHLRTWAGDIPLCIGSFFFWISGSGDQKSQGGLLRALLFEVLSQKRDLIPIVLPSIWAQTYTIFASDFSRILQVSWPLSKLMEAFKILVEQTAVPLKLFLLIDGLDEFNGEHDEMAELFKKVASPNVKVVLSSRPWPVFQAAFKKAPSLRLQDLTQKDIVYYVRTRLHSNSSFHAMAEENPDMANTLIRETVEKANGVFLWVRIVVRALCSIAPNRDDLSVLLELLRMLPPELDDLYDHLLQSINRIYFYKSSQLFQIVRTAMDHRANIDTPYPDPESLTILGLYFAADPDLKIDTVLAMKPDDLQRKCEDMEVHLKARTMGLLEVGGLREVKPYSKIQYMHRTARDFVEKPETWAKILERGAGSGFSTHTALLRSTAFELKTIWDHQKSIGNFWRTPVVLQNMARSAMFCAFHCDNTLGKANSEILDLLDGAMMGHASSWTRLVGTHWSIMLDDGQLSKLEAIDHSFLTLAIRFGLGLYVAGKLRTTDVNEVKRNVGLLEYALSPLAMKATFSPRLVAALLRYNCLANRKLKRRDGLRTDLTLVKEADEHMQEIYLAFLRELVDGEPKTGDYLTSADVEMVVSEVNSCVRSNPHTEAAALISRLRQNSGGSKAGSQRDWLARGKEWIRDKSRHTSGAA